MALIPLNPPATDTLARHTRWDAPTLLKLWHLSSLDAPTVAVVWAAAFAWTAHVTLSVWAAALLALIVWVIYVSDRILDARAALAHKPDQVLQARHLFHWENRPAFLALAAVASLSAAVIISRHLPAAAVGRDSLVGIAALAYMSGVHGRKDKAPWFSRLRSSAARIISREFIVGIVFSAGCVLPALRPASGPIATLCRVLAIPAAAFAALAWLNVHAIGLWESESHIKPKAGVSRKAIALATACLCASLAVVPVQPHSAALLSCAAMSALLLALLELARHRLEPVTLRTAADLVLLTPIFLLK